MPRSKQGSWQKDLFQLPLIEVEQRLVAAVVVAVEIADQVVARKVALVVMPTSQKGSSTVVPLEML